MPIVSVIVPVYKVEPYLRRCVDSILAQTFTDFELILVDDGSPDNCPAICDEYAAKDNRVKVIHKVNGGLSSARNAGLDVAKGEYILFVDSDDYIGLETLEKTLAVAKENDYDCVIFDVKETYGDESNQNEFVVPFVSKKEEWSQKDYWWHYYNGYHTQCVAMCNKLLKRTIFNSIRFENGRIYEDIFFSLQYVPLLQKIVFVNMPFYHYCVHTGSLSQRKTEKSRNDLIEAKIAQVAYFTKHMPEFTQFPLQRLLAFYVEFYNDKKIAKREKEHIISLVKGIYAFDYSIAKTSMPLDLRFILLLGHFSLKLYPFLLRLKRLMSRINSKAKSILCNCKKSVKRQNVKD